MQVCTACPCACVPAWAAKCSEPTAEQRPQTLGPEVQEGRGGPALACARSPLNQPPHGEHGGSGRRHGAHRPVPLSPQLHGYMESEPLTLQLFIGTADDRLLRPHAFYQVHRITGKTVSTTSHEAILSNTKVLEIPLLPENNMRAM